MIDLIMGRDRRSGTDNSDKIANARIDARESVRAENNKHEAGS